MYSAIFIQSMNCMSGVLGDSGALSRVRRSDNDSVPSARRARGMGAYVIT